MENYASPSFDNLWNPKEIILNTKNRVISRRLAIKLISHKKTIKTICYMDFWHITH